MLLLFAILLIIIFKIVIKPIYLYYFLRKLKLSTSDCIFLENNFSFYKKLSEGKKIFFNYRVATFMNKYQIIGQGGFVITDEVRLLLAATFVMLTFGMKNYLIDNFNKIIIYSENYYSLITKQYHKGEFNPALKAIVFSWKDFKEGLRFENDNLNLGLHEFAHAVYFHGLNSSDESSLVFSNFYTKIQEYLVRPNIMHQLVMSNYFRIYAYTNQAEFLAVVLEHFFETPHIFKEEFPELFAYVKDMINFDENDLIYSI
ncbi:MAG: zinc-dependent peptidase [Bacteroidota bacterium]